MNEVTFERLRKFNIRMGAMHLIQGLLMIILGLVLTDLGNFKMELTQNFLDFEIIDGVGTLVVESKVLFELPFFVLVASFLLLSAFFHGLISIPKRINNMYNNDLQQGINKLRWWEYALSSSIMIVLIAYLFGVRDVASMLLIFVVNASMNLFGLVMEQLNTGKEKKNVKWGPFIYGSIAGIVSWVVIFLYMTGAPSTVTEQTPWFVWAIVITYFIAFNTFPINMTLQYLGVGKFNDYLYGERGYIVLSLVAKTILAWLVFAGAMQP